MRTLKQLINRNKNKPLTIEERELLENERTKLIESKGNWGKTHEVMRALDNH